MIEISHVTHFFDAPKGPNILFSGLNAVFNSQERIGILAGQGAGKTSLARVISGIERPSQGKVRRHGRVSWPLGFTGMLHIGLSGNENVAIIAQLSGLCPARTQAFCSAFSELGDEMERDVGVYSPAAKARLGFALSMAIECDFYIADETIGVGDTDFRDRSAAMLEQRLTTAGLVFLSRNYAQLEKFCDRFFVLVNSQLVEVDSAKIADDVLKLDQQNRAAPAGGPRRG